MSENDPPRPPPPPAAEPITPRHSADAPAANADSTRSGRHRGVSGFFRQIRAAGRDLVSVALGKLIEPPFPPGDPDGSPLAPPAELAEKSGWKVHVLHAAAERLRGAADSYIAAKLDEIEALVDAKLDRVEARIDAKIVELHRQLCELRDRELRHRLRLLKITLIFTVLVAILSLGYKCIVKYVIR